MARLILPSVGTVVHLEGDLADAYRAAGWVDSDSTQQGEAASEMPQAKRGRPKKTE